MMLVDGGKTMSSLIFVNAPLRYERVEFTHAGILSAMAATSGCRCKPK